MKKAIVTGIDQDRGLGAQLSKRFAKEGLHVFVASRTQSNLDSLVSRIEAEGGKATAVCTDATDEDQVISLFNEVGEDLSLAIFNPAFGYSGRIIDMDSEYFERSWKVSCYGGFLFGREALKRMDPRGEGTIIYTGATAALRGRPNYAAFNSAKSGLRTLAQAMAKEYGPDGIHVGHMIIDGTIAGDKVIKGNPDYASKLGEAGMVNLDGIVDSYVHLYHQKPQAWTFELDLRTSIENW